MSSGSPFDRDSLQKSLENAYALQRAHLDPKALDSLIEIQQQIITAELDVEAAMKRIAESAAQVAGASGIALGLLEGSQLTYKAGTGTAEAHVGRQVTAALSVSGNNSSTREILHVEDADTDGRIEAAICRQFGSKALLILLIYHAGSAAALMEVHFSRPHAFDDRELRAYRLFAGLVAEAMTIAGELHRERELAADLTAAQNISQVQELSHEYGGLTKSRMRDPIYDGYRASIGLVQECAAHWMRLDAKIRTYHPYQRIKAEIARIPVPNLRPLYARLRPSDSYARVKSRISKVSLPRVKVRIPSVPLPDLQARYRQARTYARTLVPQRAVTRRPNLMPRFRAEWQALTSRTAQLKLRVNVHRRLKEIPLDNFRWSLVTALVAAFLIVAWVGHSARRPVAPSPLHNNIGNQPVDEAADVAPKPSAVGLTSLPGTATPALGGRGPNSAFRRVRVGNYEIDDIADDVTVRHFSYGPVAQPPRQVGYRQVEIGNDVTVRYFSPSVPRKAPPSPASPPSTTPAANTVVR